MLAGTSSHSALLFYVHKTYRISTWYLYDSNPLTLLGDSNDEHGLEIHKIWKWWDDEYRFISSRDAYRVVYASDSGLWNASLQVCSNI